MSLAARLDAAASVVLPRMGAPVDIAIALGSGLGGLAGAVTDPVTIPYHEIPGFPVSTAPTHAGRFVIGTLHGRRAALMQGRVHLYEGWSAQDVARDGRWHFHALAINSAALTAQVFLDGRLCGATTTRAAQRAAAVRHR